MTRTVLVLLALAAAACTRSALPPAVSAAPVTVLAPGATSGADLAAAACVRLRLARQGVVANASAQSVQQELAEARELATEAARRDPTYVALSGGVAALDEAVRRDAGADAALGLRVALANCHPAA